jgi:hypothetical protein
VRPAKDEVAPVKKRSATDLQQDAMACRYSVADPTPTFSTIRPLSCEGQKQIALPFSLCGLQHLLSYWMSVLHGGGAVARARAMGHFATLGSVRRIP